MNNKSSELTETAHDNWVTALVDDMMEAYEEKQEVKLAQLNFIMANIEAINKDIDTMILKSTRLNPYHDSEILSEVYDKISNLKRMIVAQEKEMERIDKR